MPSVATVPTKGFSSKTHCNGNIDDAFDQEKVRDNEEEQEQRNAVEEEVFDVCIIGAGPAGLATLSALHSPYSLDGTELTGWQKEHASNVIKRRKRNSALPKKHKVCVVDAQGTWLDSWQRNFEILGIDYLRSPALAHPDLFDPHALLSYAVQNQREDELLESGCFDIKGLLGLNQTQIGLWKLPSSRLFVDFCLDLAKGLPHTFVGNSYVANINPVSSNKSSSGSRSNNDPWFQLTLKKTGQTAATFVTAKSVVLAVGAEAAGRPIVPSFVKNVPRWRLWNQPQSASVVSSEGNNNSSSSNESNVATTAVGRNDKQDDELEVPRAPVLVVGGGLTAVQAALKELRENDHLPAIGTNTRPEKQKQQRQQKPRVILVSKRPLSEKHFDLSIEWFDRRKTNKCMADFYHLPMPERKQALREAKWGGSIPPFYMEKIKRHISAGDLRCCVGEILTDPSTSYTVATSLTASAITADDEEQDSPASSNSKNNNTSDSKTGDNDKFLVHFRRHCQRHDTDIATVAATTTTTDFLVSKVVVACGVEPNCGEEKELMPSCAGDAPCSSSRSLSLIDKIQSQWPTRIESGLPCVTQDLRWKAGVDLFVVGSLGALNIGPDAGNIMGIRRAAQLVANALGCRNWLRETVLANPFEALAFETDSDSDSSSSDEEEGEEEGEGCNNNTAPCPSSSFLGKNETAGGDTTDDESSCSSCRSWPCQPQRSSPV